jgi:hypothetical protein
MTFDSLLKGIEEKVAFLKQKSDHSACIVVVPTKRNLNALRKALSEKYEREDDITYYSDSVSIWIEDGSQYTGDFHFIPKAVQRAGYVNGEIVDDYEVIVY